jgi:hypothetical protein
MSALGHEPTSAISGPIARTRRPRRVTNWPEYPLSMLRMLALVSASKGDNRDSFAVFDGEDCVGHIMRTQKSPPGKPWFWTIFVSDSPSNTLDRGYAATREQAMIDFEAQWLRLARSLEKGRASGSIGPRLFTQTPHQKSTQLN